MPPATPEPHLQQQQRGKGAPEAAQPRSSQQQRQGWQHLVAGGVAGSSAVLLLHPFDVIKTRLQVWCERLAWSRAQTPAPLRCL
jgi:hypothetical protein